MSLEILSYDFMRHAFMAGTIAALLSGMVGYFIVLRNLSFASHALSHISFAGASGALLLGISPIFGQLFFTLFSALGIGFLGERLQKNDMVIGMILSFSLGLGALFLSFYHGYAGQATSILFGNLLTVSMHDLIFMGLLAFLSILILFFLMRPLFFSSLEPELAQARGVNIQGINILFVLLVAIAVTLASQVVGILLIFILIVGPAAIALQWAKDLWQGLFLSVGIAVSVTWSGLILSYYTDWPLSFLMSSLVLILYLLK